MSDIITSKANAKVKAAFELRKKPGELFLVEGYHLVEMARDKHCLSEVFSTKEFKADCPVHIVSDEIVEKLSLTQSPEGIIGVCKKMASNDVFSQRVLVLDRVQDPGNLGTILRTALSFGFRDILLLKGSCSPWNPKAIMASQGAIFALNLVESDEEDALALLREKDYAVLGSALTKSVPLETYEFPKKKIALILGNEGRGMSQKLLQMTDANLRISMDGIDSLNVGVAAGILMHAISRL